MSLEIPSIIAWVLIGLAAGYLASLIMGSKRGLISSLLLGLVGAIVGGVLFSILGIGGASNILGSVVIATVGAVIVLAIVSR